MKCLNHISCNYSCTISFLVKTLLVKVTLYSVCLNLNHEKTKCESWKNGGPC